jgi:hypothetical protein
VPSAVSTKLLAPDGDVVLFVPALFSNKKAHWDRDNRIGSRRSNSRQRKSWDFFLPSM